MHYKSKKGPRKYNNNFIILNEKRKDRSKEIDEKILQIIATYKKINANQIKKLLDDYAIKITEDLVTEGESNSKEEFEKKQVFTIKNRTLYKKLEGFEEKNFLIKKGKWYYPSIYLLNKYYNYFPDGIDQSLFYSIVNFFPSTVEESINESVIRYGLFIVYTIIEINKLQNEKEINLNDESNFLNQWLQEIISLKEIYNSFNRLYDLKYSQSKKDKNLIKLSNLLKFLEKSYPNHYREIICNRQQIIERDKKEQIGRKKLQKVYKKLNTDQTNMKYWENYVPQISEIKTSVYGVSKCVVSARVVPSNWKKQLKELSKP